MFDLLLAGVFALAVVIGFIALIVRFIVGLFAIASGRSVSSFGSTSSGHGSSMTVPPGMGDHSELAELRRKQSELRIHQARQMLIDAGINPDR